jgi:hypothetical protein
MNDARREVRTHLCAFRQNQMKRIVCCDWRLGVDYEIESRDDYLGVIVSGPVSLSVTLVMFQKVFAVCVERGLTKILFDCLAVEDVLPLLPRYELGKAMAEYGLSQSTTLKVAVVGVAPVISGFGAQVAWNRGLVVEVFSERQAALDWLNAFGSPTAA